MAHAILAFCCAACFMPALANPMLVMSIPARWHGTEYVPDPDGSREPICESCARQLLQRFERDRLPIPKIVREADYFERAYHIAHDQQDS